jgi:hypothetical protein
MMPIIGFARSRNAVRSLWICASFASRHRVKFLRHRATLICYRLLKPDPAIAPVQSPLFSVIAEKARVRQVSPNMDDPEFNYRREFLKSPQHAWLGILTLGLGFASASALGLIVGATTYVLGWIYLPDMGFFKRWVDGRREAAQRKDVVAQLEGFNRERQGLLTQLTDERRGKYQALAAVCRDIEKSGREESLTPGQPGDDPRLRKLDELMWTYLKLLTLEQNLAQFLEKEKREDLPELVKTAEGEVKQLMPEVEDLKARKDPRADSRDKLLNSKLELLAVLQKRLKRCEDAETNVTLVVSEQQRLDQQIKLVRADALAIKNAVALSARIDATVNHLDTTNKWLSEIEEFKDLAGDIPQVDGRIGYEAAPAVPPPLSRQAKVHYK